MMKSRKFSFIILLILLTYTEGRGGSGGGGGRGGGRRGGSSYSGGGGGGEWESWPWYVKAFVVIAVIFLVACWICACLQNCSDEDEDENDSSEEMTTSRPPEPEGHFDPIKTQPFDQIINQHQESSAHHNSGDPVQKNDTTLPYPVQPQEATVFQPPGEPTQASPPQAQGWINPQGLNGQQTDGVPCNPAPYPPAYDPHGFKNETPSITPPAYEPSDSPKEQSMYPKWTSTYVD